MRTVGYEARATMGEGEGWWFLAVLVGICVFVPGFFALFAYIMLKAHKTVADDTAAVRSGQIADLLPWSPGLLDETAREWIGATTYSGRMLFRRDGGAGRVLSTRRAGTVFAFAADIHNRGAGGTIGVRAGPRFLQHVIGDGQSFISVDGHPFGIIRLANGAIADAQRRQIGIYHHDRGLDVFFAEFQLAGRDRLARLDLHGAPVAAIDTWSSSSLGRPASPSAAILQSASGRDEVAELWLLAVLSLEIGCFALLRSQGRGISFT